MDASYTEKWTVYVDEMEVSGEAKVQWNGFRWTVVGKTLPCLLTGKGELPELDLIDAMTLLVETNIEMRGRDKAIKYFEKRGATVMDYR